MTTLQEIKMTLPLLRPEELGQIEDLIKGLHLERKTESATPKKSFKEHLASMPDADEEFDVFLARPRAMGRPVMELD